MSFGQSSSSSIFGANNNTQAKPLFGGAAAAPTSNIFGSTTGTTQPVQSTNLFGSAALQPAQSSSPFTLGVPASTQPTSAPSLFGSTPSISQPTQASNIFGSAATQPAQNSSPFTLGVPASTQAASNPFALGTSNNTNKPGNLFGAATTPSPTSLFGSTTTPAAPQQTNSLFGTAITTAQPQQTNSLFGASAANAQPQQTNSLFGNATSTTNTQQTGSNLFNASTAQPQTNSLFGASLGQSNQQNSGLFGGATTNNTTSSLFGNTTTTNTQQARPSMFGNTTNQAPSQSIYGSSNMMPGGGLTMGQGNQQPQSTVPGVKIDVSNIRGTTRFNDLHEELQKQIEQIDSFIQQQISFKEQCDALMPAHDQNVTSIPNDVEFVKGKADTVELALDNDSQAINTMKGVVQKDAEHARLSFRAIENLKLPQQFHYTGMWHGHSSTMTPPRNGAGASEGGSDEPTDLVTYFSNCATEMTKTLDTYQQNISEIETHLRTVEASTIAQSQQLMFRRGRDGGSRSSEDQVRELAAVLREFEGGIINVAGKVGAVREDVQEILLKQQDTRARRGLGRH